MSSHREAPASKSLSAFVGLPTLAALQVGSVFALDALEPLDAPAAQEWHVNLVPDHAVGIVTWEAFLHHVYDQ